MLPQQLRKAVEAAQQTAQEHLHQSAGEDGKLPAQEYSRLAELQKQRAHLEMRKMQAEAGLLSKTQAQVAAAGLEWLYDDPKNSAEAKEREREAFLLGKPIPNSAPKADESLEKRVSESVTKAAAVLLPTQDRLRKLREDPLLLIRQAELAQQQAQEANPLLQLLQKKQMQTHAQVSAGSSEQNKKVPKKSSKKKRKHRRKKGAAKRNRSSSISTSSSSDDDVRRRDKKADRNRDQKEGRENVDRRRSRSRSRGRARDYHYRTHSHDGRRRSDNKDDRGREKVAIRYQSDSRGAADAPSSRRPTGWDSASSPALAQSSSRSGKAETCSSAEVLNREDEGSKRVYGPTLAGAGSAPAPFRVAEELLPPLAIRQKAQALEEAKKAQLAARETLQLQQQAAVSDSNTSPISAEQKLRQMQEEGLRREAEKQRRSELVQMKELLEERIEAQRRALLDASDETRGLRPKVFSSTSVEPVREVTMKMRRLQSAINDLGASNRELK